MSSRRSPPSEPEPDRWVAARDLNANRPRHDVRMSLPEGYDGDLDEPPLTLAPLDGDVPSAPSNAPQVIPPKLDPRSAVHDAGDRIQFTLGQLLFANTLLAVILALSYWMPLTLLAGLVGVVAFGLFFFVSIFQPHRPGIYSLAWSLIVVYALVAGFALLRG